MDAGLEHVEGVVEAVKHVLQGNNGEGLVDVTLPPWDGGEV